MKIAVPSPKGLFYAFAIVGLLLVSLEDVKAIYEYTQTGDIVVWSRGILFTGIAALVMRFSFIVLVLLLVFVSYVKFIEDINRNDMNRK